jgi:hypothetical protein
MNLPSGRILTRREIEAMLDKMVRVALDGMSTDWSCRKVLEEVVPAQDIESALDAFKPIAQQIITRSNHKIIELVAGGVTAIVKRYGG